MTRAIHTLRRKLGSALAATALTTTALAAPSVAFAQGEDDAPAKPKVVMPVLKKFQDAPYPEEAQKAGVEGDVILRLTIGVDGKVAASEVVEPAGNGFDEAARQASLQFEFEPAKRDGKPVAVKILYKYSFTLKVAEPKPEPGEPEKPPPDEAPKVGNLEGRVQIAGTDVSLAGAEVVVTQPDGTTRRMTTDAGGRWVLTDVPPGKYRVRVASDGFQPAELVEEVVAGEATEVTYRLSPETEGIEVTVQGERPPREVTRRTLERREISRIPGTGGDALRSLQSLPGVARPPGLAGLLIVRGSSPQDTETFVDGTSVPLIYHFGGLSSVVPTEMLDKIDFYPGNFSSKYGRVQGGIVDVALRSPDTRCYGDYGKLTDETGCYHGMAQVDLIDTRFLAQGPMGPIDDWTFAAAYRRSWFDLWLTPVLEEAGAGVTSAPVYQDWQLITETRPSKDSKLSLRFFGSNDRLELILNDPFSEDPGFGGNLNFATSFWRLQSLYTDRLSKDVELTSMVALGRTQFEFGIGTFVFDLDVYAVDWRHEFAMNLASGVKLNTGIDFVVAPFDVTVRAPNPPRPGEPDPGPFSTRPPLETNESDTAFRPAWYAEAELTPSDRWRIVPGFRVDYARDSGHADLSPRVNARYQLIQSTDPADRAKGISRWQPGTTLKGGVGVYAQPPQFQETNEVFGTPGIESNRSIHYALGVEQDFTQQVELSVEGFYKDLFNQVSRDAAANGAFEYGNEGTGAIYGLETLLKYKPGKRFFGWVAYTLSRSTRKDGPGEEERLFQFDQTHNLTALGSYRLGGGWEFGARFRIISGPLDTPVVQRPALPSIYAADAGSYVPIEGQAFSRRLPLFHQLDVRVDKRWQFRTWRLSAYLDIQNTYNNAAKEAILYNYDYTRQAFQLGLPILPSIGVRGEF